MLLSLLDLVDVRQFALLGNASYSSTSLPFHLSKCNADYFIRFIGSHIIKNFSFVHLKTSDHVAWRLIYPDSCRLFEESTIGGILAANKASIDPASWIKPESYLD